MSQGQDKAIQMLYTAMGMEEKGRRFYEQAASECKNVLGAEMLRMLMQDELIHLKRIQAIFTGLKGAGQWTDQWQEMAVPHADLGALFRTLAGKRGPAEAADSTDIQALKTGIEFELASVDFYSARLKEAADPLERAFLEKMIVEENGHYMALTDAISYLENPEEWFFEKERGGLDGG